MKPYIDEVKEVKLHALLLLSSIHEDAHLRSLAEAYITRLQSLGVSEVTIIRTVDDIEKATPRLKNADGIVYVFLSGGVSRLAQEAYSQTRIPPLLVSHEYHNASASMMSAQSRIRFELGGRVSAWIVAQPDSPKLPEYIKAYRAAAALKKLHVVQIDADKLSKDAMMFQERFNARVTLIGRDETDRLLEEAEKDANKLLSELKGYDLGGVDIELLKKPLKVAAAALKAVERFEANAFTVDCFPFIQRHGVTPCLALSLLLDRGVVAACEADYRALTLLAISYGLAGLPGWIGNFNNLVGRRELRLSHCTIASRLTKYVTLLPHFETGNPYAVAGQMREGEYTILALSPDYSTLWYAEGSVRVSGTLTGGKCRTQVVIDLINDIDIGDIVSNHHVLVPGRHGQTLHVIANFYGLRLKRGGEAWYS